MPPAPPAPPAGPPQDARPGRSVAAFLGLTALATAAAVAVILSHAPGEEPGWAQLGLAWSPALAAALTALLVERRAPTLGLGLPARALPWVAAAWVVPAAYGLVAAGLAWLLVPGSLDPAPVLARLPAACRPASPDALAAVAAALACAPALGGASLFVAALGEELGWRGFLVPRLAARWSPARAALVGGLIWAVWHWPGVFSGRYVGAQGVLASAVAITLTLTAAGALMGLIRLASASVWPAVAFHAAHNLFLQDVLDPATADVGPARALVGEFGWLLVAGVALTAALALAPPRADPAARRRPPPPGPS